MSFYYTVDGMPACISDDVYKASLILSEQRQSVGVCSHRTAAEAQLTGNVIKDIFPDVEIRVVEGGCPAYGTMPDDVQSDYDYLQWWLKK